MKKKETFVQAKFQKQDFQKPDNCKFISYSQYSTYRKCPQQWKLKYVDKIKEPEPSIHAVFGTSMHNVVQSWLQVMFNDTVKASEAMDFDVLLLQELKKNYAADAEKYGKNFSTKEELAEFYIDGVSTLKWLRKKRKAYFSTKTQELVGVELPLLVAPLDSHPSVVLNGFIDVVIKDKKTPKFYIPDLKTSNRGWGDWDKKNEVKVDQLILYKIYFAKQYGVSTDVIDVEYMILKRKIDEDSLYPQRRVQLFKPAQGSITMRKTVKNFEEFITSCFLPNGDFNPMMKFEARSGKNNFNCRFCEFREREDLCPKQNRIIE